MNGREMTFTVRLDRKSHGTFTDIGEAVARLVAVRGERRGDGWIVCKVEVAK